MEILNADLYTGDCRAVLRSLPAESVHCAVTSPPYLGLRDYSAPSSTWADGWVGCLGSEPTLALYLAHIVEVFAEVRRVLRPEGVVWINLGDVYSGSSGAQSRPNGSDTGTTLQGSMLHARQINAHPHQTHTGSLKKYGLKNKDRVGLPHRVIFALQDAGWYFRDEIVWRKPSPMPGSQRDRTTNAHEFVFLLTKRPKYFFDDIAIAEPVTGNARPRGKNGVNPRAHSGPNGSKQNASWSKAIGAAGLVATRTKRSVWTIAAQPFIAELCKACGAYYHEGARKLPKYTNEKGEERPICECGRYDAWLSHYASFPEALPSICIKAGTSEKGCCSSCGAPWVRVSESLAKKKTPAGWDTSKDRPSGPRIGRYPGAKGAAPDLHHSPEQANRLPNGRSLGYRSGNKDRRIKGLCPNSVNMGSSVPWDSLEAGRITIGWKPTCKCDLQPALFHGTPTVVPCTVLDLFNGTGRTGLAALKLDRRYIGIDVKSEYIQLARCYISEEIRQRFEQNPREILKNSAEFLEKSDKEGDKPQWQ